MSKTWLFDGLFYWHWCYFWWTGLWVFFWNILGLLVILEYLLISSCYGAFLLIAYEGLLITDWDLLLRLGLRDLLWWRYLLLLLLRWKWLSLLLRLLLIKLRKLLLLMLLRNLPEITWRSFCGWINFHNHWRYISILILIILI